MNATIPSNEILNIHYLHTNAVAQLRNAGLTEAICNERGFFNRANIEIFSQFKTNAELMSHILDIDLPIPPKGLRIGNSLSFVVKLMKNSPERVRDTLASADFATGPGDIALCYTDLTLAEINAEIGGDIRINEDLYFWNDQIKNIAYHFTNYNGKIPNIVKLVNVFGSFADILDLNYWDMEKSLDENLTASNISPHKLVYRVCDELGLGNDRQRILGRLNAEIIQSVFDDVIDLDWDGRSSTSQFIHNPSIQHAVFLVLEYLRGDNEDKVKRETTLNHIRCNNCLNDSKFSLMHWEYILKHLTWFNDMHRYTEGKNITIHHGHSILDEFIKIAHTDIPDFNLSPNVLFADILKSVHDSIADKYAGVIFPQIPDALKHVIEELGFEHINIPAQLACEGIYMQHCAGGEGYINRTQSGDSWFFHLSVPPVETPTRNSYVERGVTVELNLDDGAFSENQSKAFQNHYPDTHQNGIIADLVMEMNRYGKTPGHEHWIKDALQVAVNSLYRSDCC